MSDTDQTGVVEAALACALRGWPVFPVHGILDGACTCGGPACGSPGKHPRTKDGHHAATTDPDRIRSWWKRWAHSNLAVRTGSFSDLLVLDVDGEPGERSLCELQSRHMALPKTTAVETGTGRHLYFRHSGVSVSCSAGRLGSGLDVRADGGYVLAPPSRHRTGKCYRWTTPPDASPSRLPGWLLGLVLARPAAHTGVSPPDVIAQGSRNETLTSIAGTMRRRGLQPEEILPALRAVNERRCTPPLPAAELRGIARSVGRYQQTEKTTRDNPRTPRPRPVVVPLASVQPVRPSWLWPGRIPMGKLTLLAGDPGLGKSLLALDVAARVSSGADWPDTANPAAPGFVLLLSAEDDPADTVRPRLDAAGADVERITLLSAVLDGDGQRCFDIGRDVALLREILHTTAGVTLLVIDPLSAYLGSIDSHANADVRNALAPLAALAAEHGVAVLAITHLRKASGKAVYRMMGSLAFVAAARSAWLVEKDTELDRRLLLPVKSNLAPDQTPMAYTILDRGQGPVVSWQPGPVSAHVHQLSTDPTPSDLAPFDRALGLLASLLANGPRATAEVEDQARATGISVATLRRAREHLGISTTKLGYQGQWHLALPKDAQP